ncbi:MAG: hypothetical protein OXF62_11490 [Caldilineaceae bacterium]|nr:hypothetical protein [Caldilineaceae bacterium]
MARPQEDRNRAERMTPLKSRLLAWLKNAGLEWSFSDTEESAAKRLMENRLDLWRAFSQGFEIGFDPTENKFYDLNDPDEFRIWARKVMDGEIPHPKQDR